MGGFVADDFDLAAAAARRGRVGDDDAEGARSPRLCWSTP